MTHFARDGKITHLRRIRSVLLDLDPRTQRGKFKSRCASLRRRAGQLDQIASLRIFCHFKIETIDLLPDKSWHGFLSHEQKNESHEQEKRKNQVRTSNSPGWEPPKTSPHVSHVQSMYRREYNRARQHTFDLRS